jgi:TrpR-related protein YerC/YecD
MTIKLSPITRQLSPITRQLCNAFLYLTKTEEVEAFLKDLCTPSEIKSMAERFEVANLLMKGFLCYREIHRLTKVSIATITRVARFLFHETNNGYKLVLKKMQAANLLQDKREPQEFTQEVLNTQVYEAFLLFAKNEMMELYNFLLDICTPSEIKSMRERLQVANLLKIGFLAYREIHDLTKVSIATITRVARFLFHENNNGYKLILNRLADAHLLATPDESTEDNNSVVAMHG